jgi:hypothetical protein
MGPATREFAKRLSPGQPAICHSFNKSAQRATHRANPQERARDTVILSSVTAARQPSETVPFSTAPPPCRLGTSDRRTRATTSVLGAAGRSPGRRVPPRPAGLASRYPVNALLVPPNGALAKMSKNRAGLPGQRVVHRRFLFTLLPENVTSIGRFDFTAERSPAKTPRHSGDEGGSMPVSGVVLQLTGRHPIGG